MELSRHQFVLNPLDRALVHALQIAPRAPWSAIARALGVDPATAARHWDRLVEDRLAWFVVRPSAEQLEPGRDAVIVTLRCRPGSSRAVARRLAVHPASYAVDVLAGDHDVVAILIGSGLGPTRALVDELLVDEPAVASVAVHFMTEIHREDGQWELGVLAPHHRETLVKPVPEAVTRPDPQQVDDVTAVLREDPRMSVADVARRLGLTEPTARRTLDRVLRSKAVLLGVDVVASAGGAGRAIRLEVCVDDPRAAGAVLAQHPSVLRCASMVGPANLMVVTRFETLRELADFEVDSARQCAGWSVRDRSTVALSLKRQGRLLDEDGRLLVRDPIAPATMDG